MLLLLLPTIPSPRSRFYVGQVKTTGSLRVSSTAPYFVDDRLYCPEEDMRESKPLHLCVSLVPAEGAPPSIGQQAGTGLSANSEISASPQSTAPANVEADAHEEGAKSSVGTHETGGVTEGGRKAAKGPASTREGTPASQQADTPPGDDVQSTPWVLDICLVRISSVCADCPPLFTYFMCVQFCGLGSRSYLAQVLSDK